MNNLVWFKEFPPKTFPQERCGHCLVKFTKINKDLNNQLIYAHNRKDSGLYQWFFRKEYQWYVHKECLRAWFDFSLNHFLNFQLYTAVAVNSN